MRILTSQGDAAELPPAARVWADRRLSFHGLHLDTAAAGRPSAEAMLAAADHAVLEAQTGAYVAEAQAEAVIRAGRGMLAELMGMPADGLAFVESASAALATALRAWPLRPGDTVAVVRSEWGPNLAAFADFGLEVTDIGAEPDGRVDLAALERLLSAEPPALVQLTQVASHRSLVQPVAAAAELCRASGVPLWVDAAQALGHVDTSAGADVIYATSRKWLAGPRGVGMLGIAERWWDRLRITAPALQRSVFPSDKPVVQLLESRESSIAARVGLCVAVRQFGEAGPAWVWQRLADVGQQTREILAEVPGWEIAGPAGAAGAITSLRPLDGQQVPSVRARLLAAEHILTTSAQPARAPREMTEPLLRISPHVDCTSEDLRVLAEALA
ncbi:MAG TPA: aminotransferase class V-fold PLP-dependent enzyme [Streptosporangiaceae bacterium]